MTPFTQSAADAGIEPVDPRTPGPCALPLRDGNRCFPAPPNRRAFEPEAAGPLTGSIVSSNATRSRPFIGRHGDDQGSQLSASDSASDPRPCPATDREHTPYPLRGIGRGPWRSRARSGIPANASANYPQKPSADYRRLLPPTSAKTYHTPYGVSSAAPRAAALDWGHTSANACQAGLTSRRCDCPAVRPLRGRGSPSGSAASPRRAAARSPP